MISLRTMSQSGRTITEMLGVLILIGILSAGALTGYSYAIDKHHSNILTDEILQRSLDIEKQLDNRKRNITLNKFEPQSKLGYDITYDSVNVGIQVHNVPKRLCEMTYDNTKGVLNTEIYLSNTNKNLEECEENNTLVYSFEGVITNQVQKESGCPAGTPTGADPDTCSCDLRERYLDEETNACVCLSGAEVDGFCLPYCATSADCEDNEVCENHICIMQDEPATTLYETTNPIYETSHVYETSSVYETTEGIYSTKSSTTTRKVETTTWHRTTTYPYTSTNYPTTNVYPTTSNWITDTVYTDYFITTEPVTSIVCASPTPVWNGTECVTCASADASKPYWNGTECVTCASVYEYRPYWDGSICTTCSPTKYWNGTECVSCASVNPNKPLQRNNKCMSCSEYLNIDIRPYWNGNDCVSCASVNASKPYWNGSYCTTCPSSKPYWDGYKCIAPTSCSAMGLKTGLELTYKNSVSWGYTVGNRYETLHIYGVRSPSSERHHTLELEGYIYAPTSGYYKFRTHNGCTEEHNRTVDVRITIDGNLAYQVTSACAAKTKDIYISAGLHRIHYYMYTLKRSTAYLDLQTESGLLCSN